MQFVNVILFLATFCSLSSTEVNYNEKDLLGSWSLATTIDGVSTYNKVESISASSILSFEENSKVLVKTVFRDGFCGTPPHAYRTSVGKWTLKTNLLSLEYEYKDSRTPRINLNNEKVKTIKRKLVYEIVAIDHEKLQLKLIANE